ncbi:MAG TPA: phosphoenolpyruvate--protein phosphotransferase, partial [Nordella sp.]|nr:phosphoenolpyruvate--protein phosphotransferase [Nordella sp.]
PVFRLEALTSDYRASGDIDTERRAFDHAVTSAIAALTSLAGKAEGEGADMLGFQVALLEDDALLGPARALIAQGQPADAAWRKTVDAEIVGYELSDDDYFRARAADLKDMRDRVLRHLSGADVLRAGAGVIWIAEDVPPSLFLEADWSQGGALALRGGSPTSHVALLARARGVPMITGLGDLDLVPHDEAVVDGGTGRLVLSPDAALKAQWAEKARAWAARQARADAYLGRPALLRSGAPIELLINVAGPEDLDALDIGHCDGIGLMRSEFLFRDGRPLPDEDSQYRSYRRFLDWARGKPVTIRTLDIGGDKPVKGLTPEGEKNPFLGVRGTRLMLKRRDVFRAQLRALVRASAHGPLKIMLPMITVAAEFDIASALLDEVAGELGLERPPLGIMVEVPAVALVPELFAAADFFSIGSNDLTQYVMAASRDEAAVAELGDPSHPAVLRLIAEVARYGRAHGMKVSLCGDMASDPRFVPALIAAGLTSLSVAPAAIARVKAALAETG